VFKDATNIWPTEARQCSNATTQRRSLRHLQLQCIALPWVWAFWGCICWVFCYLGKLLKAADTGIVLEYYTPVLLCWNRFLRGCGCRQPTMPQSGLVVVVAVAPRGWQLFAQISLRRLCATHLIQLLFGIGLPIYLLSNPKLCMRFFVQMIWDPTLLNGSSEGKLLPFLFLRGHTIYMGGRGWGRDSGAYDRRNRAKKKSRTGTMSMQTTEAGPDGLWPRVLLLAR
jgi:hypothetical protein